MLYLCRWKNIKHTAYAVELETDGPPCRGAVESEENGSAPSGSRRTAHAAGEKGRHGDKRGADSRGADGNGA